ncbi:MAG: substrate-binding domain-containing protein [Clostridiales Family XIII bacterium]|jgi:inositol transport system substrate-binding protein|nr:substrate-binding domain-containing protein [Clostridiales Family XIII bacterium]
MKKLLCGLLVAMMCIVLVTGCGGNSSSTDGNGDSGSDSSSESSSKKGTIGLSMGERDEWLSTLENGVKAAAEKAGYKVNVTDAQKDMQTQIDQVKTLSDTGVEFIICLAQQLDSAESIRTAAGDVPIIFVNRQPDEQFLEAGKAVFVGSDALEAGTIQATWAAEYFKDKSDKTLDVIMLEGNLGDPNQIFRTAAAYEGLEAAGFTINKVFEDTADFDRAKALDKIQTFLGTGKHFDLIISNNDEMALGAIEAMRTQGLTTKEFPVLGIDGSAGACKSIEEGELSMSVFQNGPGQGAAAVDTGIALVNGDDTETVVLVPWELITPENVADFAK